MRTITRDQNTVEYLKASVVVDVELVGLPVSLAITRTGQATTWLPAGWVGVPTTSGTARTSTVVTYSAANYPPGDYLVRAKITAAPEDVILDAYYLQVIP